MKKIQFLLLAMLFAVLFTACDEPKDDNAVFHKPTRFVLNTPAFVNQYYELTENGMLEMSCSQPDYGFGVLTQYEMQISLNEDFREFRVVTPEAPTLAAMRLPEKEIAEGICKLLGFSSEDDYDETDAVKTVYFRARAFIRGVEGSEIVSNVVKIGRIKYYPAIKGPNYIFVVGDFAGWKEPIAENAEYYKDYRLYETAEGSGIYTAQFEVAAGKATFRFYTGPLPATGGWSTNTWGLKAEDKPTDVSFTSGEYNCSLVAGKGSLCFPNWPGGVMTMVVNIAVEGKYTATIYEGAKDL